MVMNLRQRKKAATRKRILDTALRLFARRGFESPTVEEIAVAARVGKGTIYNYFRTKEDILVAFIAAQEARVQQRLSRLLKRDLGAESLLTLYLREQFRLKRPYRQFTRVFLAQLVLRGEEIAPQLAAMQPAIDGTLAALFESLRRRGKISDDVETEALVRAFKTLHLGLTVIWAMLPARSGGVDVLSEETVRQFCRGLEKGK